MAGKRKSHKQANPSPDHSAVVPVSLTCACNRDLTEDELGAIYPNTRKRHPDKIAIFLPEINKACNHWGITSCLRKAHFFAQVSAETGDLLYMRERDPDAARVHEGYEGRGLFQLTGKGNYEKYGISVGHSFLGENRAEVEEVKWAADSGAWFWSKSSFNDHADKNDFIYIVQIVNAAFNGWDSRKSTLKRAAAILLVDSCKNQNVCWDWDNFHFHNSALNRMVDHNASVASFAWGYWFDPASTGKRNVVGTTKNAQSSIEGYAKFLALEGADDKVEKARKKKEDILATRQKPGRRNTRGNGRFGFDFWYDMIVHANERLSSLSTREPEQGSDS